MALVNENFLQLTENYLFADIAKKVNAYKVLHPRQKVISLGIGDVTQPLCPSVIKAMHKAVDEMANAETFKGYGPEHGYAFLREAILKHDFHPRGIRLDPSEIFINDGAKSDLGNIGDILRWDNLVAVTDPVYPVYVDSNAMAGRAGINRDGQWSDITYLPTTAENDFCPELPDHGVDVIYLCYPNNPTGTVLTKAQLEKWVKYALKQEAIILYDAAYEAYIQEPDIPHSIYEIRGARKCAIEFHSYSKTAGFTGVRCGYTVVPKELIATSMRGQSVALNHLWERRQSTKFNGTSYISQRAAEAIYTPQGQSEIRATIAYYMENAKIMRETLQEIGFKVYGGVNAPYLWVRTPHHADSWAFFEELLYAAGVVCTPGEGFGPSGKEYVRLTAFCDRQDCLEAMSRIRNMVNQTHHKAAQATEKEE
ncbi:MAG: LL-diaminopimelate aminotransferase [Bacteroidales bacterium]|nr:LL-diaminopimelate aminotransferase [Bacteroidales bacterium]